MSEFGVDPAVYLKGEDLVESSRVVEISSSGSFVVFTIKKFSISSRSSSINLYLHNSQNLQTKQMTRYLKGGVSNPTLSLGYEGGEDSILYLKDGQIWALPIEGGESIKLSSFPLEIESFKICRGVGAKIWLLCVFSVYADKSLSETIAIDKEIADSGTSGMVFDNLMVRHWDTWNCYAKRNHVFVCPVTVGSDGFFELKSDELRDLMFGLESDCPVKPFGGSDEYSVSPDGQHVTLACRKWLPSDGKLKKQPNDMAWSTDIAIFLTPVEGRAGSVNLLQISPPDRFSTHSSPTWSDDSKKIAFLSMANTQYESDRLEIVIYDIQTQQSSFPTHHLSLSFSSLLFAPQSSSNPTHYTIYATSQYRASIRLFELTFDAVEAHTNLISLKVVEGDETKMHPMVVANINSPNSHHVYYLESSLLAPNIIKSGLNTELFSTIDLFSPLSSGFLPLLDVSRRVSREIYVPCPEYFNGDLTLPQLSQFYFRAVGADGQPVENDHHLVHAWYLPPAHVRSAEQEAALPVGSVPLVLIIHGGPQGAILNTWNYRWNLSYYASKGYGVCAVNFHGSTSFGQAYCDSIRRDWGGQPFRDCIQAVDTILSHKSYLNSKAVGALGASYGGFMINWLNGNTTKFKCLVNHDGIFDLKSLYYSTEELWFPEWEFGLPWLNGEDYDRFNPSKFVSNWKTPTLVIQGGKDHRVVETEGLSTFTALQRQGIPSQLLFFPDENHWCLKPMNSLKWHSVVTAWLDRWLKDSDGV